MLKKSTVNKPAPFKSEGKAHGASAPKTVPNRPGSTKGHVLIEENQASGPSKRSTFTAPRREPSTAPMDCGFTRPGKA